jgi:hypothetical protein
MAERRRIGLPLKTANIAENGPHPIVPATDLLSFKKEPQLAPVEVAIPSVIQATSLEYLTRSDQESREYGMGFLYKNDTWTLGEVAVGSAALSNEGKITPFSDDKEMKRVMGRFRHPTAFVHTHPKIPEEMLRSMHNEWLTTPTDQLERLEEKLSIQIKQSPAFEHFAQEESYRTSVPSSGDIKAFIQLRKQLPLQFIYSSAGVTLLVGINKFLEGKDRYKIAWREHLAADDYAKRQLYASPHAYDLEATRLDWLQRVADIIQDRGIVYFSSDPANPVLRRIDGSGNYNW